jgi:nicotinate phosphoribosyltransferase
LSRFFAAGKRVYDPPPLEETRRRVCEQLAAFHPGVKRLVNPHRYPVGLELCLHERKMDMIDRMRRQARAM